MKKQHWLGLGIVVLALTTTFYFTYQKWTARNSSGRAEVLALMAPDAAAVFFADFDELRRAAFIGELYAWAPKPQADVDYAEFLKGTGFDYERDLHRVAISLQKHGKDSTLLAIADGNFDREKISAYASKIGSVSRSNGREIFSVPLSGSASNVSFAFLRNDRIALVDNGNVAVFLVERKQVADATEWHSRFERLAGSPLFAVIRQDAAAGSALEAQAPGGLRSPQLSTLLDQLQWITLAGKPENDRLRVVAEGECAAEATVRQVVDLLNGVVLLAQAGLNDAKAREQLDPATRDAYLELLKSADVSKIDRGDMKSVRLVFELTSKFLEAARTAFPGVPEAVPDKHLPRKHIPPKKGHT